MIERFVFEFDGKTVGPQGPNPFVRGGSAAPLRITFHTSALTGLSGTQAEALAALEELSSLPALQSLHANPEKPCWMEYNTGAPATTNDPITVTAFNRDGWSRGGNIFAPRRWQEYAAELGSQAALTETKDVNALFQDLLFAQAHIALSQHILVTTSPFLVRYRHQPFLRPANIRTPQEAAQMVGILLRSQGVFVYRVSHLDVMPEGYRQSMNRGLFYWALARHRLPNMWHYFSACLEADRVAQPQTTGVRHDIFGRLGESILRRADRAIRARDAIGMIFYLPQNNDTQDDMMYHFDYLTLLLTGAIDAQARIAYHAYHLKGVRERNASFRRLEFVNALKKHGAAQLHSLVTSFHFQQLTTLLYGLRNTVHGSALSTIGNSSSASSDLEYGSYIHLQNEQRPDVELPALRLGGLNNWGITRTSGLFLIEPYSFSTQLTAECLRLIDQIAAATDLTGLFQNGTLMPALQNNPPQEGALSEEIGQRLAVLG